MRIMLLSRSEEDVVACARTLEKLYRAAGYLVVMHLLRRGGLVIGMLACDSSESVALPEPPFDVALCSDAELAREATRYVKKEGIIVALGWKPAYAIGAPKKQEKCLVITPEKRELRVLLGALLALRLLPLRREDLPRILLEEELSSVRLGERLTRLALRSRQ